MADSWPELAAAARDKNPAGEKLTVEIDSSASHRREQEAISPELGRWMPLVTGLLQSVAALTLWPGYPPPQGYSSFQPVRVAMRRRGSNSGLVWTAGWEAAWGGHASQGAYYQVTLAVEAGQPTGFRVAAANLDKFASPTLEALKGLLVEAYRCGPIHSSSFYWDM